MKQNYELVLIRTDKIYDAEMDPHFYYYLENTNEDDCLICDIPVKKALNCTPRKIVLRATTTPRSGAQVFYVKNSPFRGIVVRAEHQGYSDYICDGLVNYLSDIITDNKPHKFYITIDKIN
jgi:hypothetical protein